MPQQSVCSDARHSHKERAESPVFSCDKKPTIVFFVEPIPGRCSTAGLAVPLPEKVINPPNPAERAASIKSASTCSKTQLSNRSIVRGYGCRKFFHCVTVYNNSNIRATKDALMCAASSSSYTSPVFSAISEIERIITNGV